MSPPGSATRLVRIFTACHGTQLLVIQHLRRHLQLPAAREFLLWHPMENIPLVDEFMRSLIATAGFADTLDMRQFASLRPRTQGPWQWWLESARRLRSDATTLHRWMESNRIAPEDAELWADDPIHFNVIFTRGMLHKSRHVKIPHCFNLEDVTIRDFKNNLEKTWRKAHWPKRFIYHPWLRWSSGVDLRVERTVYDRAYTFDQPSPWSTHSVDMSGQISIEAFDRTYRSLPSSTRAEVEAILAPLRTSRKPLVLLLLFGLGADHSLRAVYQASLSRIFSERASELRDCSLAVKLHPAARGTQEQILIDWLRANVPAQIHPIAHGLNLEFMLPQLQPDYVLAGVCGALPIVRKLRRGRPVVLGEMLHLFLADRPEERDATMKSLKGIEIW